MIKRSEELSNWLRSNPSELPGDNTLFSTLLTFEAIYGTVWWGADDPESNDEGANDVDGQRCMCSLFPLNAVLESQKAHRENILG